MLNDTCFTILRRTRRCRFCGKRFTTTAPARKTCYDPACAAKGRELVKAQNAAAQARYVKRKRAEALKGRGGAK